jgi:heme/copper-type cytochrome/quinol oxidase subunit 3
VYAAGVYVGAGAAATVAGRGSLREWRAQMSVCRTFWHYLGGVWLFLFALMSWV